MDPLGVGLVVHHLDHPLDVAVPLSEGCMLQLLQLAEDKCIYVFEVLGLLHASIGALVFVLATTIYTHTTSLTKRRL